MQVSVTAPTAPTTFELRSAEILALVRATFAEKGFDGASMQDLAKAAGISVGNFYRYFPSKSAIVEQLIAGDLNDMQRDFSAIMQSPTPMQALREQVGLRISGAQTCTDGQLWAEISAVALRKPEIGLACINMESTIAQYLLQVFALETKLSLEQARQQFAGHAAFLVLLVKSAKMMAPQNTLTHSDQTRDQLTALILQSIDQTLAAVASLAPRHA